MSFKINAFPLKKAGINLTGGSLSVDDMQVWHNQYKSTNGL